MTWQYPQPRTLTRVSIFPVPFKSASESGIDFGDDKEVCMLSRCLTSIPKYLRTVNVFMHESCHVPCAISSLGTSYLTFKLTCNVY